MGVYSSICEKQADGRGQFAVLIDPDNAAFSDLDRLTRLSEDHKVDYFFVGGSLLSSISMKQKIRQLKSLTNIPLVLFPGDQMQVEPEADAVLFLSLISGRNAEMLIGRQVISAPYIKKSGLESIATGYMIVDGGKPTTASYMSSSTPMPYDKPDIAATTAMAGEMLGLKIIYMDTGSGAEKALSTEMIKAVRENVSVPIITGGGIRTAEEALRVRKAGSDLIVVGNALERDPGLMQEISAAIHSV